MRDTLLFFVALSLALTVGRALWVTPGENPFAMSGATYAEFFQQLDPKIAGPAALTGVGGTLLAGLAAFTYRRQRRPFPLLIVACGLGVVASTVTVCFASAQSPSERPPVIDMHVHSTNTTPEEVLGRMETLNIRYLFVAGLSPDLPLWAAALNEDRYLPSIAFPCPGGRAAFVDRPCWETAQDLPEVTWLREELRSGRIKALGELIPQYFGMLPDDERLEPYWSLAEEFDIPVAIHLGPGPPGAAYESSPSPVRFPEFRMAAGDPLRLEEVLLRHKRLRLLVMHAGWPRLEAMLALLYAHPNVYVDVGALQAVFMVPRPSYYAYLKALADNGFASRIVFGSDFPNQVDRGIEAIVAAEFLTDMQKRDILCGNAMRFLRLEASVCAP